MPLVAVLTPLALQAAAAVYGFGWVAPLLPPAPPVEAPAPTAVPAPAPSVPVSLSAPTPAPAGARPLRPIGLVAIHEPVVAITFDACATRSYAYGFDRKVFDLLTRE